MDAIKFLLENGADVNTKNSKNFTLLMYCAKHGDLDLIQTVLKHNAQINLYDLSGFSALDYSVMGNNLEVTKYLVENGAIITDNSYMIAVEGGFKKIVRYFDELDPNKEIFFKERYA